MRLSQGYSFVSLLLPIKLSALVLLVFYWLVVPTAQAQTPTPAMNIKIYQDPMDDSVKVIGGMCQRQGEYPVLQPVPGTTAKAFSASLNQTFWADLVTDDHQVVLGHDSEATDYQVSVLLPTPAPGHVGPIYACSCPYSNGQDFVCEYSNITANEEVAVFVTDLTANEAWWQVYGGQVYAKYHIRSKIPTEACALSGTCIPSLLVASDGDNSVGFVTMGAGGLIETDRNGSDDFIHQVDDRSTAENAYATGLKQQQIDYAYYYQALKNHMAEFSSLSELQTLIAAQGSATEVMYYYTGGSPLVIDQTSASPVLTVTSGKRVTIFVPANLEFANSYGSATPQLTSVSEDSFLGFFVAGDVTITADVGYTDIDTDPVSAVANLTAVVVTDGQLLVASDNDPDVTDRKLIAEGTYVAWDKSDIGNGIVLRRNFDNSSDGKSLNSQYPSEVFRFKPSLSANYPTDLKITAQNWQEIAPQR